MSFERYPEYMYEIVNQGPASGLGVFTITDNGEIDSIQGSFIFYRTDLFTTEQIRLKVTRSDFPATPIYSEYFTCASIENFTTNNHWIGKVKFNFARQALNAGSTVTIELETQNYTHTPGNGTEIGAILKFVDSSGAISLNANEAADLTIFQYR